MQPTLLGREAAFPQQYAPEVLCPLPRAEARRALGIGAELPFQGEDIWNAWELCWLKPGGRPVVGTATFYVPADSPNIIESKSLKLYLGSFAMTEHPSRTELLEVLTADLSGAAGAEVDVNITTALASATDTIGELPGECIDEEPFARVATGVDAGLLVCGDEPVSETLHSHVLRSNCPVTNQPDTGSVMIRYRGKKIDRASLLAYIVSYRLHNAFHEACVEQMFVDIKERCAPDELTVYARYNRRGGLDINPFRSDFEPTPDNVRLWRQ